jgi:hypothetical protein
VYLLSALYYYTTYYYHQQQQQLQPRRLLLQQPDTHTHHRHSPLSTQHTSNTKHHITSQPSTYARADVTLTSATSIRPYLIHNNTEPTRTPTHTPHISVHQHPSLSPHTAHDETSLTPTNMPFRPEHSLLRVEIPTLHTIDTRSVENLFGMVSPPRFYPARACSSLAPNTPDTLSSP